MGLRLESSLPFSDLNLWIWLLFFFFFLFSFFTFFFLFDIFSLSLHFLSWSLPLVSRYSQLSTVKAANVSPGPGKHSATYPF